MKIRKHIKSINEYFGKNTFSVTAYHGTRSKIPFPVFLPSMIGTGLVSSSNSKYGGFFFTTEKDNAEYYTEYFIAEVLISSVENNPTDIKSPSTLMNMAADNNTIYKIDDILDGSHFSDIIIVPSNMIDNIKVISWEFVGEESWLFEKYDTMFGDMDEDTGELYVSKDSVSDVLGMLDIDLDYLLSVPVFDEYYKQLD